MTALELFLSVPCLSLCRQWLSARRVPPRSILPCSLARQKSASVACPLPCLRLLRKIGRRSSRIALTRQLKIKWRATSLIGLEWNALTYAGHTVWNVHNEFTAEGYKGGVKRRPRGEWVIQRDTHPALISDAVAETVLKQIEKASHGDGRQRGAAHLLTGILKTPSGGPWYGNRTARSEFYRAQVGKGSRSYLAERVDRAVIETVAQDLQSPAFVAAAVKSTREKFAVTQPRKLGQLGPKSRSSTPGAASSSKWPVSSRPQRRY